VSQDNGSATSESIAAQINIADQASGKNVATQNASLYNLYKQRSYTCSVVCLGNAMLQPTMYFNLRHVPMFNGPYMILQVEHSIQPGQFQTSFQGIRQGIYDLPAIDSFIQSMNQNLLTKLEGLLKIKKDTINVLSASTNSNKASNTVQSANNTKGTTNECGSQVLPIYLNKQFQATNAVLTGITETEFASVLKRIMPNNPELATIIYCISYLRTFQKDSNSKLGKFNGWNNNFATAPLNVDYGQIDGTFLSTYSCVNLNPNPSTKGTTPVANFATVDNFIAFMSARLRERVQQILDLGLVKYYACYWPVKSIKVSESYYDTHIKDYAETKETFDKALTSALSVGVATKAIVEDLKNTINKVESQGSSNGVPTTTAVTSKLSCPPSSITSFSPLSGNTGTVVQVNGISFDGTTSITVNGVSVPATGFTVFNDTTLRFNTPIIGTGTVVNKGKIVITTPNGTATSTDNYTFDPAITASAASSPGGYNNPQNQTANAPQSETVNTNPQTVGPVTMIGTDVQLNASKTQSLTVKINPQSIGWVLSPSVDMSYTVYELEEVNNVVTRKYISKNRIGVSGQVVNGVFNVTLTDVESYFINDIPKIEGKTQIDIMFILKAYKGQEQPVVQQFPFKVWYTLPNQNQVPISNVPTSQTLPTFPQLPLSLIRLTDSVNLQGQGWSYYNIKKPAGGYITYNFTTDSQHPFKEQNVVLGSKILDASTYEIISHSGSGGPSTNYTNEITVQKIGSFRLQVQYKPYGDDKPNGGEVLTQTILSDVFTL